MLRSLLFFLALNTLSLYLVDQLLDDFSVSGGAWGYVLAGAVVGALNLFLKPLLQVLSLPFLFLTAGLFFIVINAAILWLSVAFLEILDIAGIRLVINGVVAYMAAVLLLGILNYLFQKLIR